jgi:hypothetical protein
MEAHGFDVNPAAWILSKTYHLINVAPQDQEEILSSITKKITAHISEPGIFESVDEQEITPERFSQALAALYASANILETTVLDSLVILLDLAKHRPTKPHVHSTLFKLTKVIRRLPYSEAPLKASLADARSLPIADGVADFVVTSPPYINVFNYHQNYRRSAETLGWNLLKVAKSEIGSNRANRGNRFLTVTQYCLDLALVLRELCRVCNESSRLVFIVGHESNVLGVPFYNAAIISRLANGSGVLKPCLTQKRVFKNKFGRQIREDLLHLYSNGSGFSADKADEIARSVAAEVLLDGLSYVPDKNRKALQQSIEKVPDTASTPVWNVA